MTVAEQTFLQQVPTLLKRIAESLETLANQTENKQATENKEQVYPRLIDCDLSTRAINCLAYGLNLDPYRKTVEDVSKFTRKEVWRVKCCGAQTINDIEKVLAKYNLTFKAPAV